MRRALRPIRRRRLRRPDALPSTTDLSAGRSMGRWGVRMRPVSSAMSRTLGFMTVMFGLCSCDDTCLSLAKDYAAELPNARMCDPNSSASQCDDKVNTVDYEVSGQDMTLTGLGVCKVSANPTKDGKLKQILSNYTSAGCELKVAPCPAPGAGQCEMNADGSGTCE